MILTREAPTPTHFFVLGSFIQRSSYGALLTAVILLSLDGLLILASAGETGRYPIGGGETDGFTGKIREVRLYRRALNRAEAARLFRADPNMR